jgi:rubredoxin
MGPGPVRRTERCSNGAIRRRHQCQSCGYRWTTHEGEPPGRRGGWPAGASWGDRPRNLSTAEVELILTSQGSIRQIARAIGRSHPAVAAVLTGRTHADLFPELPRRQVLSCLQCRHWSGRCGLGFPDPEIEGPAFAVDCGTFLSALLP